MEVRTEDFLLNVARGNVTGAEIIHKFGGNADVGTTTTPITTSGTYQTPSTPLSLEILSSDGADTAGGGGAHEVYIEGIGPDWEFQGEYITMNGTTPVASANQYLRIFRMSVSKVGSYADSSTGAHAGEITLRTGGGTDVWAVITTAEGFPIGSSEIACYTVPKGYEALILHREIDIEAEKLADIIFFYRENADQITPPFSAMKASAVRRSIAGLSLDGSPAGASKKFVGPCDLGYMATGHVNNGTAKIECAFKILLLKKKL